jgi:hypothetical protein
MWFWIFRSVLRSSRRLHAWPHMRRNTAAGDSTGARALPGLARAFLLCSSTRAAGPPLGGLRRDGEAHHAGYARDEPGSQRRPRRSAARCHAGVLRQGRTARGSSGILAAIRGGRRRGALTSGGVRNLEALTQPLRKWRQPLWCSSGGEDNRAGASADLPVAELPQERATKRAMQAGAHVHDGEF